MRPTKLALVIITSFTMVGCNQSVQTVNNGASEKQAEAIIAEAQAKADAILAEAEIVRQEVERKQASQEIQDLTERVVLLNKKIETTGNTELMISRFTISKAEIYLSPEKSPTIQITVKNGTDYPVSRAYFHGTFKAKFREIPYAEGDFNYRIPGGLEPGEEAQWTLENIPWISPADFPENDATSIFEVDIMRIDNSHGEAILDRTSSKTDLDELDRLQSKIAQLKDLVPGYTPPPPPAVPEPLPDPSHTPALTMKKDVTGNVYTLDDIYHVNRECEALNGAIPSVTKAENARKRRMAPCPKCIG